MFATSWAVSQLEKSITTGTASTVDERCMSAETQHAHDFVVWPQSSASEVLGAVEDHYLVVCIGC